MKQNLAFIGLGVMGYPMAGHLAKAGHHVTVYNRTTAKAQQWLEEYSGQLAYSPQKRHKEQTLFLCVLVMMMTFAAL